MATDLAKYTEKWFSKKFDDSDEEEGFLIRFTPDNIFNEILERCTDKVKRKDKLIDRVNYDRFNFELFDFALRGFRGFVKNGKPIECNDEAKKLILENRPDRALFVVEIARTFGAFGDGFEETKKNLNQLLNILSNGNKTNQESTVKNV